MSDYRAPIEDMRFVLTELAGLADLAKLPGFEEATPDLVDAILEEAGKLASEVIAPLNQTGDQQGLTLENGVVRMPDGFHEAYRQYVESGWNALPFDPDYGGQGLPWTVAHPIQEMWNSANMSFGLCPLLTLGAVELLQAHGTQEQKDTYLPKLISGEWTGTMNLTEPQAGSDVGAAKTRAVKDGQNGRYRIKGQKIYITYGEHDLTDNIVHMVLARTPDAPPGTKGISLFIVPKFLPNDDGTPGERNDLRCVSIEHKLGIHASPTCTMAYGDDEGAVGFIVGEENHGIEYMFTMMNNARLAVGLQGVAIAERAYQQALAYAKDRTQSRPIDGSSKEPVAIIRHPDVRRMLMTMRALTEATRALSYVTMAALDRSNRHPDEERRKEEHTTWVDFLTPVVKAWSTDVGCEVASLGIQVHGGMGYIEETGAAQHYRDARIAPIYEGTNGIQAMDLIGRKTIRLDGAPAYALCDAIEASIGELSDLDDDDRGVLAESLEAGAKEIRETTDWLLEAYKRDANEAAAAATPYLRLVGTVAGDWLLARGAGRAANRMKDGEADSGFLKSKIAVARFYAENIAPQARANALAARKGAVSVLRLDEESL